MLASVFSKEDWLLITTERVFASMKGVATALSADDIQGVGCDANACADAGQSSTYELEYISLRTFSGVELNLRIQSGGGYLGIISVLHMIAEKNCRRTRPTTENRKQDVGREATDGN